MTDANNRSLATLEERLVALETRVAFQEDLLTTLNEQVTHQQLALNQLWEAKRLLQDQLRTLEPGTTEPGGSDDQPPPHY